MDATIPVSIAVIGWLMTHILNIRAQKQKVLIDAKNEARLKISNAIRQYQEWLSKLQAYFYSREMSLNQHKQFGVPLDNVNDLNELQRIQNERPNDWNWFLEEYEILFHETSKVRAVLQGRATEIDSMIIWFFFEYFNAIKDATGDYQYKRDAIAEIKKWDGYITDQICLLLDIRVHIHNRSLGEVTERFTEKRKIAENSFCRVLARSDGNLEIVDGLGNKIIHQKLPFSAVDIWEHISQ